MLMGKFHKRLTEVSICDTIMVGYYGLTFLFREKQNLTFHINFLLDNV